MQLELAPHVQAGLRGDPLIVGAGRSRITATMPSEVSARRHVLEFFLLPRQQQDIERELGSTPEFMNAYASLRDSACLVSSNDLGVLDRYSRNGLFFNLMGAQQPSQSQQRLGNAKALVRSTHSIIASASTLIVWKSKSRFFLGVTHAQSAQLSKFRSDHWPHFFELAHVDRCYLGGLSTQ